MGLGVGELLLVLVAALLVGIVLRRLKWQARLAAWAVIALGGVALLNFATRKDVQIVSYGDLLSSYSMASAEIVDDTAPFPATPVIADAAAQLLTDGFLRDGTRFGGEGEALRSLCEVAHPTATCDGGELLTAVSDIVEGVALQRSEIIVEYRLSFRGGFTGTAYEATVRTRFERNRPA